MNAINTGLPSCVEFFEDGTFHIFVDSLGTKIVKGNPYKLEDGISFGEVTFKDWIAVFTDNGGLDKNCLGTGETVGKVTITQGLSDTTKVEVTLLSGRIRETNR